MKIPVTLALCVLSLALPGCARMGINRPPATAAAGGTAPPSPSVSFMEADRDGNARITPEEYSVRFAPDGAERPGFEAADTNHDGVLTLDEWQALMTPPRANPAPSTARR
jgi:hypothetical protein